MSAQQLKLGVGRCDVTPAPGTPHAGWGAQTHQRGIGADLPLYATALVLSDGIKVNRRLSLPDGRVVVGRNWEGVVDHTVRVVRFDDLNEQPVAAIVHYACHPTIMAWQNQWVTPDYPGMARRVVEEQLGGLC